MASIRLLRRPAGRVYGELCQDHKRYMLGRVYLDSPCPLLDLALESTARCSLPMLRLLLIADKRQRPAQVDHTGR